MTGRKRITTSAKAKAWAAGKGAKRPHFKKQKPKGRVIYENPKAVPVKATIAARRKRTPFKLENVEWVSKREQIGEGGVGRIYYGKIKFSGKSSSQDVVIKEFKRENVWWPSRSAGIIEILDKSKVPHPKMIYFQGFTLAERYIVMEPFLRTREDSKVSKFREYDLIRELRLMKRKSDREIFKQSAKITAELAKNGLLFRAARGHSPEEGLHNRIDVFNAITLEKGQPKVFVQDLDTFGFGKKASENWQTSKEALLKVICDKWPLNRKIAEKILREVEEKEGFS